jgi:hypothetical protein
VQYRTRLDPLVHRQIIHWGVGDLLIVDVHLRLNQELPRSPKTHLRRDVSPFSGEGMVYEFDLIDPQNRMRVHQFLFQVFYAPDEQTLLVTRGAHRIAEGF